MECIKQGTMVITMAIVTHGRVISLDLTPEQNTIFDGTRLFTLSGKFDNVQCSDEIRYSYFKKLYSIFRENLDQTTYENVKQYKNVLKPKYTSYLRAILSDLQDTDVCQVYPRIDFDKAYYNTESTTGIYLISIHIKNINTLELIYPNKRNKEDIRLDTLNGLCSLNDKLHMNVDCTPLINRLNGISKPMPERNSTLDVLDAWNITIDKNGTIKCVRLSYLIYLVKCIVSGYCSTGIDINPSVFENNMKLNVFDFSCSSIHEALEGKKLMHYDNMDIETGIPKFGGK